LVKKQIINPNTGLKWTIHGEEIMINHFIDLSKLLNAINIYKAGCVPYKSIHDDITSIVFQDNDYIHSNLDKLEHLYSLKELRIRNIISNEQFIGFSRIHNLEILLFRISTDILTIPLEYKNLKNLHTLNIDGYRSQNSLIAAPRELGVLQNLKSLSLTRNSIKSSTESLESITQLKNLEYLNLSNNSLTRRRFNRFLAFFASFRFLYPVFFAIQIIPYYYVISSIILFTCYFGYYHIF
jgi:Leucine-rich repeat (LRR) protein